MTPQQHDRPGPATHKAGPVLAGLGLAAAWSVLAWVRPATTWHLAPVLIAVAPVWIDRQTRPRASDGWTITWIVYGATIAAATTGILSALGLLAGPALIGANATVEALAGTATGVALAVPVALWGSHGREDNGS